MKVVGILGSPRRGGNSEILLDNALKGAESSGCDTEKIVLNELDFVPCQECAGCDETGVCVIDDDMGLVYAALKEADALILASPIFFGSLSAQVKMMVDRVQSLWIAKYILCKSKDLPKRPGIFIAVGGQNRPDFFENAKGIVKNFFATTSIAYFKEFYFPSVNKKAEIKDDQKALDSVFLAGKDICRI